jgi:hypothetical protein
MTHGNVGIIEQRLSQLRPALHKNITGNRLEWGISEDRKIFREPMCLTILESFFGKGAAGRTLKVFFKIEGFPSVSEGNGSFYTPGFVFRSMRNIAGIMRFQAGIKVFCKTGIESLLIGRGLKDVNIVKDNFARLRRNGSGLRFSPNSGMKFDGLPRRSSRRAVA